MQRQRKAIGGSGKDRRKAETEEGYKMVIVCGRYTEDTEQLLETTKNIGLDTEILIWNYDGFLPEGVRSPWEYVVSAQCRTKREEKKLFYAFLRIPDCWEVRAEGINGAVFDMGCKKATIYFQEPVEERNVQRVEWCMEDGRVYRTDFYNQFAQRYASEFHGMDNMTESRVFYSDRNEEIIVEWSQNEVVQILENGKQKVCFHSYGQFLEYFIRESGLGPKRALFIQKEEDFELLKLSEDREWEFILFSDQTLLDRYIGMGGKNGYEFCAVPETYSPHVIRREALILTASDQLEGIDYLIDHLEDIQFHIAANTQVSDKIRNLAERKNVKIYPQVHPNVLERLWETCDLYLDINYYREIQHAVRRALWHHLLLMGFEETVHNRKLFAEELIFSRAEPEKMIQRIKWLICDSEASQIILEKQRKKAYGMWENIQNRLKQTEV